MIIHFLNNIKVSSAFDFTFLVTRLTKVNSIVMDNKLKMALKLLSSQSPHQSPAREPSNSRSRLNPKYRKGSQGIILRNNSNQKERIICQEVRNHRNKTRALKNRRNTQNHITIDEDFNPVTIQKEQIETMNLSRHIRLVKFESYFIAI